MFIVTKLLKPLPWYLVFGGAALLQIAPIHTSSLIVDEFASRYVYFFAGYFFAPYIFKLAEWARNNVSLGLIALLAWGVVNGVLMFNSVEITRHGLPSVRQIGDLPVIALMLGFAGAVGVIILSALLAKVRWMSFLRFCGQNSIVVYLAFFFPMAVSRAVLLKFEGLLDLGTISALVTASAVIAPLVLYWLIKKVGFGYFLFERPAWAHLDNRTASSSKASLTPAE